MVIYELHVRDFSANDATVLAGAPRQVPGLHRDGSNGMKHLKALADAGLTDVHLLPVFDFATVPEAGCAASRTGAAPPDSEAQQARVKAVKDSDCFNWGYDPVPLHRARRQLRHRRGRRRQAHRRVPRDGAGAAPGRPARGHGRGLQPHHRRRAEREVGARPHRAGLLPPA